MFFKSANIKLYPKSLINFLEKIYVPLSSGQWDNKEKIVCNHRYTAISEYFLRCAIGKTMLANGDNRTATLVFQYQP